MTTKTAIAIIAISTFSANAQAQTNDEAGEPWFDASGAEEDAPEPTTEAAEPEAPPEAAEKPPPKLVKKSRKSAEPKPSKQAKAEAKQSSSHHHHHHHCFHGHCGRWHAKRSGGSRALALTLGKGNLEMPRLADRMEAAGYPALSKDIWVLGLEGTRTTKWGFVYGLGGQLYRTDTSVRRTDGADAVLRGGALHVKLGHTLVDNRRWLVYPALQVGGYKHRLVLDPTPGAGFDDVLGDPARESELSQGGAFVGAVLAIDKRFAKRWRGGNGFWSLGLRVGVTKSFWTSGWRLGDSKAHSGPKDRPQMAYVALAIGGGRWYGPRPNPE